MGRTKIVHDENGQPIELPFTEEEEAEFDAMAAELEANRKAAEKEAKAKAKLRAAALDKLGLTEAEINALFG